jgi:hypothetical protein
VRLCAPNVRSGTGRRGDSGPADELNAFPSLLAGGGGGACWLLTAVWGISGTRSTHPSVAEPEVLLRYDNDLDRAAEEAREHGDVTLGWRSHRWRVGGCRRVVPLLCRFISLTRLVTGSWPE